MNECVFNFYICNVMKTNLCQEAIWSSEKLSNVALSTESVKLMAMSF